MNLITEIFLVALALSLLLQLWLDRRQIRHVLAHRDAVPEAFRDHIPLEAHRKAADYTV
ncbi:MAG TPA: M48 family peptidase, partial [Gammaproteobacteria bacterium]|nr:M48 family peptidase [Gammaproteobacteria bacterium]